VRRTSLAVLGICGGLMAMAQAAFAFDHGCGGRNEGGRNEDREEARVHACSDAVERPARYVTETRPVVVVPARREEVYVPAVVEPRPYRVEVAPARVYTERVPAVYATVLKSRLVEPARTAYVTEPAIVERRDVQVMTHAGGVRWQRTIGRDGRERMCKVEVAPRYRTVERTVVVAPARRVAVHAPAIYRDVPVRVEMSPAHNRVLRQLPAYVVERRPVVLKPAAIHIVDHPPVVVWERQRIRAQ
jgi:hypothetical protein